MLGLRHQPTKEAALSTLSTTEGEVYKARDTRLGRLVAIKVSKEQFSERFEREARAVAALNHPH